MVLDSRSLGSPVRHRRNDTSLEEAHARTHAPVPPNRRCLRVHDPIGVSVTHGTRSRLFSVRRDNANLFLPPSSTLPSRGDNKVIKYAPSNDMMLYRMLEHCMVGSLEGQGSHATSTRPTRGGGGVREATQAHSRSTNPPTVGIS